MKVMLNMKKSQLRRVLETLGGTARIEGIVINIEEKEFKKEHRDLTTEDLQRTQEIVNQDDNGHKKPLTQKKFPASRSDLLSRLTR